MTVCPFGLKERCPFDLTPRKIMADPDTMLKLCSMCVKAAYAKAKLEIKYSVVNTL